MGVSVPATNLSLWDFACTVYAQPLVQQACLDLQDQQDIDVPLLLFCCWSGLGYGAADQQALQRAVAFCQQYNQVSVTPLRRLRRQMKVSYCDNWPIVEKRWSLLREQVKAVELESERLLLEGLESLLSGYMPKTGSKIDCITNIQYCFTGVDIKQQPIACILQSVCGVHSENLGPMSVNRP